MHRRHRHHQAYTSHFGLKEKHLAEPTVNTAMSNRKPSTADFNSHARQAESWFD